MIYYSYKKTHLLYWTVDVIEFNKLHDERSLINVSIQCLTALFGRLHRRLHWVGAYTHIAHVALIIIMVMIRNNILCFIGNSVA